MKIILTSVARGLANRTIRNLLQLSTKSSTRSSSLHYLGFFCRSRYICIFIFFFVYSHLVHDLDLRVKKTLVSATSPVETRGGDRGGDRVKGVEVVIQQQPPPACCPPCPPASVELVAACCGPILIPFAWNKKTNTSVVSRCDDVISTHLWLISLSPLSEEFWTLIGQNESGVRSPCCYVKIHTRKGEGGVATSPTGISS